MALIGTADYRRDPRLVRHDPVFQEQVISLRTCRHSSFDRCHFFFISFYCHFIDVVEQLTIDFIPVFACIMRADSRLHNPTGKRKPFTLSLTLIDRDKIQSKHVLGPLLIPPRKCRHVGEI